MNNKVPVFGQRRAGVYLLSEIYNPDDVTSSVQTINKVVPAIGSLIVDDTVGNHNTLYVVYSVDAITHRSTLVPAGLLDTTDDSNLNFSYGNNNYKLFFSEKLSDPVYYVTEDTEWKPHKDYYIKVIDAENPALFVYEPFMGNAFESGVTYYEAIYVYEAVVDSRLSIYNNDAETFTVFKSVAIGSTDGNNDVISWFYKLTPEERHAIDPAMEDSYLHNSKVPLLSYTDTTITNSGAISSRSAKSTRYFYTPFELKQGEKYLLIVNDNHGRPTAQVLLEGQPMLEIQRLNGKYRMITSFDIWTADDDAHPGERGIYIPRNRSIEALQFYFNITYDDGTTDQLPGIDNIRLFAYGLEDIDIHAAIGTEYEILFKYFVPSVEQINLVNDSSNPRNYSIGPTKRYIYKKVKAKIVGSSTEDLTPPVFDHWELTTKGRTYTTTSQLPWTNEAVVVRAIFTDDVGVDKVLHRINDETTYAEGDTITVTENNTRVYFIATDISGKQSESVSCLIDKIDLIAPSAPTITMTPDVVKTAITPVRIHLTTDSDVVKNQYSTNGTTWVDILSNELDINSNDTYYFRSLDAAGNKSESTTYGVTCIDKIQPIVTAAITTSSGTSATVTAEITNIGDNKAKKPASAYPNARIEYAIKYDGQSDYSAWSIYNDPVTVDRNCVIKFCAYDGIYDGTGHNDGNRSADFELPVTISGEVPRPTISINPTEYTSGNVTATITYDSSVTKKYYVGSEPVVDPSTIADNLWQDASTNPINLAISENCVVYAKASSGIYSAYASKAINNIDKASPTITNIQTNPAQETYTSGSVIVTAVFNDTGVSQLRDKLYRKGSSGSWLAYSDDGVEVTDNTTIYFKAIDNAGNESEVASQIVANIDKTAPVVTATPAPTQWTQSFNLGLSATDNLSGVNKIEYQIDGTSASGWLTYSNTPVSIERNCTVYYRATDNAGNTSTPGSVVINKIDRAAPLISDIDFSNKGSGGVEYPTNQAVEVTAIIRDVLSGVDKVWYRVIDSLSENPTVLVPYTELTLGPDSTVPANGVKCSVAMNGVVEFIATDKAGNTTPEKTYYHIITKYDAHTPAAPSVTGNPPNSTQTTSAVILTATYDSSENIVVKQYAYSSTSISSGYNWQTYTDNTVSAPSNGYYYFRGSNEAGSWSNIGSYQVTNIITAVNAPTVARTPEPSDVPSGTNGYTTSVTIEVTDFNGADSVDYCYKVGSGSYSGWATYTEPIVVNTENRTYKFRGKIGTLYSSEVAVPVNYIDVTAPTIGTITHDPPNGTTTHNHVTVYVPVTDSKSGVECVAYSTKSNPVSTRDEDWTRVTSIDQSTGSYTFTISTNGTIYIRAMDKCGNKTDAVSTTGYSHEINNIISDELISPTIEYSPTEPTYGNVTVTITYDELATINQYNIDNGPNGPWQNYGGSFPVSYNCHIYARSNDGSIDGWVYSDEEIDNILVNNLRIALSGYDNTTENLESTSITATAMSGSTVESGLTIYWAYSATSVADPLNDQSLTWSVYGGPLAVGDNGYYYFKTTKLNNTVTNSVAFSNIQVIQEIIDDEGDPED